MWERLERREIDRRGLVPGPGERPRPDLPPNTDLIPKIKHIVVLMQENHSYDNYLGTLTGRDGERRGDGLPAGPDGQPDVMNKLRETGQQVRAHHLASTVQIPGNPSQTWNASHISDADRTCGGFAQSIEDTDPGGDVTVPLGYWTEDDLGFYHELARVFPVADRWFCSCLGPTFPNRRFLIAGTAHGLIDDLPWDLVDYPPAGTIFDLLSTNGITWTNYHNVHPAKVVLTRVLGTRGLVALRRVAQLGRWLRPVTNAVRGNKSFTADLYPLGLARCVRHLRTTQQFFADARDGKLPAVSIVDPDFGEYSEENPQDILKGESFSAAVVKAVMKGPGWGSTLLLWIYDEHGGYYDHVVPPDAVAPDAVPARNWQLATPWFRALLGKLAPKSLAELRNADDGPVTYDRYGFRVPAVIVSPYARPDFVLSDVLDHTSVLRLIEEKWNLPSLTHRDATAKSPMGALDLDAEPAFATPPDLPESKGGPFKYS